MRRLFILCSGLILISALAAEKDPALSVQAFYSWYVRELLSGTNPLQKQRAQVRQFATERFLANASSGRDPFLNTREVDPDWARDIAIGNSYVGKTMSKLHVILSGHKAGDREFDLKLVVENGIWKIDEIKFD